MSAECNESLPRIGTIYSAEGKLVLDHGHGRLTVELCFIGTIPVVVAHVDHLSADLERSSKDYALRLQDLPVLLEHAATILRQNTEPAQPGERKLAAAT